MYFHLSLSSSNQKTGPIPVSTSSIDTCPKSCAMHKICYAKFGPLNIHWNKVTKGLRGSNWESFTQQISNLPSNTLWRHNQAGDLIGCKSNNEKIDEKALKQLVKANKGKKGFSYTHKWKHEDNFRLISYANNHGLTINFSADSIEDADYLVSKKSGPVVCVVDKNITDNFTTPAGNKVVICPNIKNSRITCLKCKLCANPDRKSIIGFPAHGIKASSFGKIA